ncbi:hypothetical protein [Dactylosporangium sp. CA-233914]|uniref:hypothetical protein n=1 Tax=Dactylosporangium sp. CA-233914 TaxID=3239934 RepID=UPI003D8B7DB4
MVIYFSLKGIPDPAKGVPGPVEYAMKPPLPEVPTTQQTAWELGMIRDAPASVRPRVHFYDENGDLMDQGPFGW